MSCKSCGSGGCSTGACGKLNVFDWLADMAYPADFDAVEIKFKGGRKAYYRNVNNLYLATSDLVVVGSKPGHHVGVVSAQGEIVRLQMKKNKVKYNDELPVIYREATEKDLEKYKIAKNRELTTLFRTRVIVSEMKLAMKLSDVEYQADNTKATFYYSAEDRVDFRELIKKLAAEFKIRVEMKQISLRHEAGRLGGIGSCGRELCCSTWLTDFKSVTTSAARYQNLSLNPSKLSGQCGRLKCCLNYELETYIEALKHIPDGNSLEIESGRAKLQKTDIFKRMMWYSVDHDANWIPVSAKRVTQIREMNEKGKKPFSLEIDIEEKPQKTGKLNSDIHQLDKKLKGRKQAHNQKKGKRSGGKKNYRNKKND